MKKLLITVPIIILCAVKICFSLGRLPATVTNTNNVLIFKLKPSITTTTGFSTIEFFLKYLSDSPAFNYSPVMVNRIVFSGMTSAKTLVYRAWEIERNNPVYFAEGYNIIKIKVEIINIKKPMG